VRVTIWGCRGSVATPGPKTVEYGGNTSCVEVSLADGTTLVLDASGREISRAGGAPTKQQVLASLGRLPEPGNTGGRAEVKLWMS